MADNFFTDGTTKVQNAANSGNNAINSFDPSGFSRSVQNGQNSLYGVGGAQNNQMDSYIQKYKDTIKANPTATDLYGTANNMFNVPTLQQNANTLNNAVLTAPQTTLDSARGFNYDNNQVQNQTNLTLGRLAPLAGAATNEANTAEGLAKGYVDNGMAQNEINLQPVQTEGDQLKQLWAQQATGFDENSKNTLDALAAKMQAGVQLSTAEMSAFTQLSQMEESYQQAIGTTQLGNQYQKLPAGTTMVNTFNGSTYHAR